MCHVAIGSQTVGSVLRPAAYCGIVGLKPTYGRVSKAGAFPLATSLDHTGIFARSVADVGLVLSAVAGPDPADDRSASAELPLLSAPVVERPRLGLVRAYYGGVVSAEVAAHLDEVAGRLAAAGALVSELELPLTPADVMAVSSTVLAREAAGHHQDWFSAHAADYGPNLRRLVETGMAISDAAYAEARYRQAELRVAMAAVMSSIDCLLLPVAPSTAPRGLSSTGDPVLCALASVTGLPSIALPSGIGESGLPLAVQLVGAAFEEGRLLGAADRVASVLDFRAKPRLAAASEGAQG
jgi:amidase